MTDLEISKALALAIGWPLVETCKGLLRNEVVVRVKERHHDSDWRVFDYRECSVIWPIEERYKAFPQWICITKVWWVYAIFTNRLVEVEADTPQKAIALAVIQGADT